eukprot:TRINITY_DN51554_c0_g1_i1.p1 TRINITY_DN51554_c0_g1~~TRINITY_DN51554_c0_g1_i1.p1  ORF type:complete len:159 (+),score=20.94 TRINITY_DN51554_c0_g1_i1:416-892(+)
MYPHCCININAQILSSDGSLQSCLVNSCMCALLDAAIECKRTVFSICMVLMLPETNTGEGEPTKAVKPLLVLDPVAKEEATAEVTACFVTDAGEVASSQTSQVVASQIVGIINSEATEKMLVKAAHQTTKQLSKKVQEVIRQQKMITLDPKRQKLAED